MQPMRARETYSMEFKCKVVAWYFNNLEQQKNEPIIKLTR